MKNLLAYTLLLLIGFVTALYFGFYHMMPKAATTFDDEQTGLKDQLVFKFSHVVADNTPKGLAAKKFAELVHEKSDGKITIQIFSNGSLYSDIEEINALKENQVQFIAPSTSKLGMLSSEWLALDLPFAFSNYDAVQEGLHGAIGQRLFGTLQKDGLKGMAYWTNGFKQITSNKGPIKQPSDLKNQSLRIMQSDMIEKQFKLLGAKSYQESFNSTFQLLETKKVDGEENTISNIYSKKFYHIQDYMTISNHGYLGYVVLTDQSFFDRQTPETKRILLEAMEETTAWNEKHAEQMNKDQLEDIKRESPIAIHELTPAERQKWMKALDPLYEEAEKTIGSTLIKQIRELRARYEHSTIHAFQEEDKTK
ncbi:DctP family TRAP transporter solute-binding subunit [Bacillus sp. FSL K6-2971]|uniref:DctP family TRAP transporter solute-binding subunit n=1 Tax=Bacillus sp. FSL K6-2971 TaxID=2921487 RepID=UPI0030F660CC